MTDLLNQSEERSQLVNQRSDQTVTEKTTTNKIDFLKDVLQSTIDKRETTRKQVIEKSPSDELSVYLNLKNIESTSDVFVWWHDNGNAFPRLRKLALKYLIIPATSSLSERVFSTAGYLLGERRTRLKDDHLNMLIFLNNYYSNIKIE